MYAIALIHGALQDTVVSVMGRCKSEVVSLSKVRAWVIEKADPRERRGSLLGQSIDAQCSQFSNVA